MKRLKVLVSAYACRPGEGSEPGVGWNVVRELVKYHDIWVLTREDNRASIETELANTPLPGLQFIYCEPPSLIQKLNHNQRLVYLHYYLWQIKAYSVAKTLHSQLEFDIAHHVTYVRYSTPSFLALLPVPFVWGPVGGAESAPAVFWTDFSIRSKIYETLRDLARRIGELDPFVHMTAKKSVLARGTTEDTTERLKKLGAQTVETTSQLGLSDEEIAQLVQYGKTQPQGVRFISMGRLLHWKGFHLGLKAFAQAELPEDTEYWIIGDGPERSPLENLAKDLGIHSQVKFWNKLSRSETLQKLADCGVLVHPSLHESGGLVCLEAMAAGRPVICLNLGGPALQVTPESGFKVSTQSRELAEQEMATAMKMLAHNPELRITMGKVAQQRVKECYSWPVRGKELAQLYELISQNEVDKK